MPSAASSTSLRRQSSISMDHLHRVDLPAACGSFLRPSQALVVEPFLDRRFDDLEVGREVEIGWCEKAVMPDVQDLLALKLRRASVGREAAHWRQDGIAHMLECLGDQRRAD